MGKAGSAAFSVLQIDSYDLLPAKVQAATWKTIVRQEVTHGLGDRWEESTPTGIRAVEITQDGAYFDTRAGLIHAAFKDTPLVPRTLVLVPGDRMIVASGTLNASYDVLATNGSLTKANVTYVISGAVSAGAILQPATPQSGNWTSAVVDDGAATANGGSATQLVTALTATGFVGTVEHSPDTAAWTPLVAFPNVSTPGPPATLTIAGTINRYLRFSGALSGAGTVTVVASVTRA